MEQTLCFLRKSFKAAALPLFILLFSIQANCQDLDYKEEFGEDYSDAVNYLLENQWMEDSIATYGLDPYFTLAVIFPELIRYNALNDFFETRALEVLYIQYGTTYADFSIGRFQIKPSFAETIELEYLKLFSKSPENFDLSCISDFAECRDLRVKHLKKPLPQLYYLVMFVQVMDRKYKNLSWNKITDKLAFYATAYNTGFFKSEKEINKQMKKKSFHTAMYDPTDLYSYSDICIYFYKQLLKLNQYKKD
jgi:hypothetical protein